MEGPLGFMPCPESQIGQNTQPGVNPAVSPHRRDPGCTQTSQGAMWGWVGGIGVTVYRHGIAWRRGMSSEQAQGLFG